MAETLPFEPDVVSTAVGKRVFVKILKAYPYFDTLLFFYLFYYFKKGGEVMNVVVNGNQIDIKKGTTLFDFLKEKNIDIKTVVIEYNFNIVKDVQGIELNENDNIEILRIVGGG